MLIYIYNYTIDNIMLLHGRSDMTNNTSFIVILLTHNYLHTSDY